LLVFIYNYTIDARTDGRQIEMMFLLRPFFKIPKDNGHVVIIPEDSGHVVIIPEDSGHKYYI